MARPLVSVEGGPKLRRALRKAGADLDDLKVINFRLSQVFVSGARARAPRGRSGKLAKSIRPIKARTMVGLRAGSKAVPYVGPVHWGWPSRPDEARGWRGGPIEGNNFATDAAKDMLPGLVREWEAGVQKILDSIEVTS